MTPPAMVPRQPEMFPRGYGATPDCCIAAWRPSFSTNHAEKAASGIDGIAGNVGTAMVSAVFDRIPQGKQARRVATARLTQGSGRKMDTI